jgi:tRNA A-37 threonylcarbamoyl transferase component Bud32
MQSLSRDYNGGRKAAFDNLQTTTQKLITDASNALRHLHHLGILHQDAGMSNIAVSSAGVVKLIDFGLSQFTDSSLKMAVEMDVLMSIAHIIWSV